MSSLTVLTRILIALALLAPTARNSAASGAPRKAAPPATRGPEVRLLRRIHAPGIDGRLDHLAVDQDRGRLYLSARDINSVEVFDLKTGANIHTITGVQDPLGLCFDPATDRLSVACGGGRCQAYDGEDFWLVAGVQLEGEVDNIRVDSPHGLVYAGFGNGSLAVFGGADLSLKDTIPLKSHPEGFCIENQGPRIFVNVPALSRGVVLDRKRHAIVARWRIGAADNYPMALDEAGGRLFIGCRSPSEVRVLSAATGAVVDSVAIDGDADDMFVGAGRRVYVSCGDGYLDVLAPGPNGRYRRTQRLETGERARTSVLDAAADRLYVAVPQRADRPAEILEFKVPR